MEDQGNVTDFLGIQVKKHDDSTIWLTQLQLINSILKDLHLQDNTNTCDTPLCPPKSSTRIQKVWT